MQHTQDKASENECNKKQINIKIESTRIQIETIRIHIVCQIELKFEGNWIL